MLTKLRRQVEIYLAMAALTPKLFLAYNLWVWVGFLLQFIQITMYVFFWRAVYADTGSIAGLSLQQTLNYILLAQIFAGLVGSDLLWEFGYNLREGGIAHVLLRPLDMQLGYYVQGLAQSLVTLILQLPFVLLAVLAFGLQLPTDWRVWAAFAVALWLGRTVIFFFDWMLACLTFYITEVWGLGVLIGGLSLLLSGQFLPLDMMPDWLRLLVQTLPFSQGIYVPISILSGITPLDRVPQLWAVQALWLVGLLIGSRWFFNTAVRKVTVQGG